MAVDDERTALLFLIRIKVEGLKVLLNLGSPLKAEFSKEEHKCACSDRRPTEC